VVVGLKVNKVLGVSTYTKGRTELTTNSVVSISMLDVASYIEGLKEMALVERTEELDELNTILVGTRFVVNSEEEVIDVVTSSEAMMAVGKYEVVEESCTRFVLISAVGDPKEEVLITMAYTGGLVATAV